MTRKPEHNQVIGLSLENAHSVEFVLSEKAKLEQALDAAINGLEWYVEQDNGSHAVTVLNKVRGMM